MTELSQIYLLEVATGQLVEAELRDAIEEQQLLDWQQRWLPELIDTLKELSRRGVAPSGWPQSAHWNWRAKMASIQGLLGFAGSCVVREGVTQGLMSVNLTRFARHPDQKGKPLVYIDYLEVAPWNRSDLGEPKRYQGVGRALLAAAVALSETEGFSGRVGLHSLPQANAFYERCGMAGLGADAECQGLVYFELTPECAQPFLREKRA